MDANTSQRISNFLLPKKGIWVSITVSQLIYIFFLHKNNLNLDNSGIIARLLKKKQLISVVGIWRKIRQFSANCGKPKISSAITRIEEIQNYFLLLVQRSRYSDRLQTGRPKGRSSSPGRSKIRPSPRRLNRFWGPPSLLSNGYRGALSLRVKWPGRKADQSPPIICQQHVDLYIHFHIRLHGVVLNLLITGTTLPYLTPGRIRR
jgi:hypothetical protein